MVDQTKMNGRTMSRGAGRAVRRNVAGLIHDVVELAELQVQLVSVDVREAATHAAKPALTILAGVCLALGAVPILLLGVGWTLINRAGISEEAAFVLTAVGALLIAAGVAWIGWLKLKSTLMVLSRSKQELAENVHWIKDALSHRDSPT